MIPISRELLYMSSEDADGIKGITSMAIFVTTRFPRKVISKSFAK